MHVIHANYFGGAEELVTMNKNKAIFSGHQNHSKGKTR